MEAIRGTWNPRIDAKYRPVMKPTHDCSCHVVASPADAASFQLLKEQVEEVLNTLNDRERRVLQLRFGLEDGRSRTLEEVGREFGVTRERIRQIEAKALRKLRHPTRSRRLKVFLD